MDFEEMTKHITKNIPSYALGCIRNDNKKKRRMYIDDELVEKSRALGFNLSRTFDNHLKQLISQLSNNQSSHNSLPSKNEALWWAGPDSDRRPSARQADVLTKLDDRPTLMLVLTSCRCSEYLWVLSMLLNQICCKPQK